ncbi:transcription factor 20-like [Conger conger]|uniref:transcription factor 20-like n=1 Tax=Conger conger TaxID=82655 RepID=UPI002A5AFD16|nr:transcription factor 20-like [Conger conger]XP_061080750.1 transcription factor 20-like [Conger conger]XP_061080751.1 transcription factor 20-like [Conger conger]XP_061080752.1 transcription factor 20-like [Conger conger]XP_061080753.1 transcription factor 20-like [Conger conger]
MDPLSQGHSMDDGLPLSPSTCSLPTAFDLSTRRRHSPMNSSPVARAPRWCRGVDPPENSSAAYRNSLSTQQVQPDNAFSNTTVTLSYINRSHVHSTQDQIAPKIHSVSTQTGSLSQRSPLDSKGCRLVSAAGRERGGCRLQAANRHVDELASQSKNVKAYSEVLPMERAKGRQGGIVRLAQQAPGFNGKHEFLGPGGAARPQRCHVDSVAEGGRRFSQCREDLGRGVPNGVFWDAESCMGKYSNFRPSVEQRTSGGESSHRGKRTSRKLYSSLNEDFMSPLDESLSPAESSEDEMEDLGCLPQTLNSPSSDSPYAEEDIADVSGVKSADGEGCRFTVQFVEVSSSPEDSCSDDSDVIEVPVTNRLAVLPGGLPQSFRKSPVQEECLSKKKQLTHATKKTEQKGPEERLNGNTLVEERAVGRKKQPPRAARQEVVVGNVTPLRSKSSSHTQSVEPCAEPETLADHPAVSDGEDSVSDSACDSEAEASNLTEAVLPDGHCNNLRSSRQKSQPSTSGSEDGIFSNSHNCSTSSTPNEMEKGQAGGSPPRGCPQKEIVKTAKRPKKTQQGHAKRSRTVSKAAQKSACSKKRKKYKPASQPSAFSPREPEIKLKYASYREEKRDSRAVSFAPYVHLENKEYSSYTVINYLEEETGNLKKGRPRQMGQGLVTGTVPGSSYLELGRLDPEERRRTDQVCCLCSGSSGALDLGDLHGPYRPHEGQQGPGAPAEPQGPKGREACSDSDSSYEGRPGKSEPVEGGSAQPHGPKREAAVAAQCRWVCDEDSLPGAVAKTPCPVSNHSDKHSTPTQAQVSRDFWLHEDCGVWSMGVFLVRGRLYGLEEAVRLAQGTVCSTCHEHGATLGCFFKGCPNKYHYRCAVQSDCVLNDENFTMKCTKHKNKSLKGVSRTENR